MKRLLFLLAPILVATSTLGQQCDASLWQHTYHQQRFTIISQCKSFTGVIEFKKPEPDGDVHIRLRLDPGQGHPLNHGNVVHQHSCLVVEPICEKTPTQSDAIQPCKGARKVPVPAKGAHVRVRGVYAVDDQHGWIEVHAAEIEVIP
jgi:hypothetical protein